MPSFEECRRLARIIADQHELRKQGELHFSEEEARKVLAKVGEFAEGTQGGDDAA